MHLTMRQAEALLVARDEGSALLLLTTTPRNGPFISMIKRLKNVGLLTISATITRRGIEELEWYERRHRRGKPLSPRTAKNPKGRWA